MDPALKFIVYMVWLSDFHPLTHALIPGHMISTLPTKAYSLQCCLMAQKCVIHVIPVKGLFGLQQGNVSLPKDLLDRARYYLRWEKMDKEKRSPISECPSNELCQAFPSVYYEVLFSPKRTLLCRHLCFQQLHFSSSRGGEIEIRMS